MDLPVIGLWKIWHDDTDVFITPTLEAAKAVWEAGAEIIALDCTSQITHEGRPAYELLPIVKKEIPEAIIFADVSNYEEAVRAVEMGADIVGPTLYGYTEATKHIEQPDLREFARMCRDFKDKAYVIMEGHIYSPEDAMKCIFLGAHSVVVGSAITRPHLITKRFTDLLTGYQITGGKPKEANIKNHLLVEIGHAPSLHNINNNNHMANFNVEGAQNVEISKKIPCEKPLIVQLEIMERYTAVHKACAALPKEIREVECLKVLYPTLFRKITDQDLIAGRTDFLPIGFGCVTSLGGVGHYCVFKKLRAFQQQLDETERKRVDTLYDYWLDHDLKTQFNKEVLTEDTLGMFIDCEYPMIATARLSGMMLDYPKLLDKGIGGLRSDLQEKLKEQPDNNFYKAGIQCLDIFVDCASHLQQDAREQMASANMKRQKELERICQALENIKEKKPGTFHEAMQLFWLFALLAGVINYGRLDDYLGPYLVADLKSGRLTDEEAYRYIHSLWTMIENRRTTVNGRIIVGGKGRKHPKEADVFLHIAMKVAKNCRYVEPQFTLRFDKETSEEIWDEALDALGAGATYPTLYNDDVNVPAVMYGMRVDEKAAEQYVPFGCTEFVIQGQSTGTPNICINLLKLLTIYMNDGIDPIDGKRKSGPVPLKKLEEYQTFEEFYDGYKALLDYYLDLSVKAQYHSYEVMNQHVSFLFTSLLTDDCIARGKRFWTEAYVI